MTALDYLHSWRGRLVDEPDSWASRRRAERAGWLLTTFPDLTDMTVVDLGGRAGTWAAMSVRPDHVDLVNLEDSPDAGLDWIDSHRADACSLPDHLRSRRYDLVFSNSVIEHVGGHERRERFAETVHQLAPAHWIQTPYRYFPIEPHWLAPGFQFLPIPARSALLRRGRSSTPCRRVERVRSNPCFGPSYSVARR